MGRFEPQVLESIRRSRRKVLLEDILVLVLLSLWLFICAFLAFAVVHREQWFLVLVVLFCAVAGAVVLTVRVHRSYSRFFKKRE